MDEEIDRLVVSVRADTAAFSRDVAEMRAGLEGPLAAGADRAGRAIEASLLRVVRTGKLGFDDLRRVALSAMAEIAEAAIANGIDALFAGGNGTAKKGGSDTASLIASIASIFAAAPGRATGGPVSPGRAYRVGERGPELFVPTSAGQVVASPGGGGRDVRVSIRVDAARGEAPQALARSGRQVARAVRRALVDLD